MSRRNTDRASRGRVRAFTLTEAVLAMLVVSVMLVAALNTVGAARSSTSKLTARSRGAFLARGLMTEILQQAYADAEYGLGSWGVGPDEVGDGSRSLWEDVDDYDGWSASPPEDKEGTVIPGFDDWERTVTVEWINPVNLDAPAGTETGIKRITVTVKHRGVPMASLCAYRTFAWRNLGEKDAGGSDLSNNPPQAVALADPLSGWAPLTVTFFGGTSSDPDGDALTYEWAFGDGDTGSGEMTAHTYEDNQDFTVTLTVSDGRGAVDTDTLTVRVWD